MAFVFNPSRTNVPAGGTNIGALINAGRATGDSLSNLGLALNKTGVDLRSGNVADLISSGGLEGLTSEQARNKIAGVSQGSVNEQAQSDISNLIGGLQKTEAAKTAEENAMTKLGININADLQRQDASDTSAMARLLEQGVQKSSQGFLNRESQKKISKANRENNKAIAEMQVSSRKANPNKPTQFQNIMDKFTAEQFTDPEFFDKKRAGIEQVFDKNNWFFDAEFVNDVDKSIIDELVYQAAGTPDGNKALANRDSFYSYAKPILAAKGKVLKEGITGDITIEDISGSLSQFNDNKSTLPLDQFNLR